MTRILRILLPVLVIALAGGCGKVKDSLSKPKTDDGKSPPGAPTAPPPPTGGSGTPPVPPGITAATQTFEPGVVHPADAAVIDAAEHEIGRVLVIDFYADWCIPCKRMAPILEELAKEYGQDVIFLQVNADQQKELVQKYKVTSIPDVRVLVNGKQSDGWNRLVEKATAKTILDNALLARLPAPATVPVNTKPPIEDALTKPANPPPPRDKNAPVPPEKQGQPPSPPILERKTGEERVPEGMKPY